MFSRSVHLSVVNCVPHDGAFGRIPLQFREFCSGIGQRIYQIHHFLLIPVNVAFHRRMKLKHASCLNHVRVKLKVRRLPCDDRLGATMNSEAPERNRNAARSSVSNQNVWIIFADVPLDELFGKLNEFWLPFMTWVL